MTVLITGASSGIGAALAEECARRGDTLFLCGRDASRLAAVEGRCRAAGAQCSARVVDVCSSAALADWIAASDEARALDLVIANAGIGTGEESAANVRATFATNVGGVVNTVLPAIDVFRRRRAASRDPARDPSPAPARRTAIAIVSSIAGYGPLSTCPAYSATKACVKTWGLALRGMLRAEGIAVSVICPGFVRSRITERNTCPMPFFMEAPEAARKILGGIAANRAVISFPAPLRLAAYLFSILPAAVAEILGRLLPPKVSRT